MTETQSPFGNCTVCGSGLGMVIVHQAGRAMCLGCAGSIPKHSTDPMRHLLVEAVSAAFKYRVAEKRNDGQYLQAQRDLDLALDKVGMHV